MHLLTFLSIIEKPGSSTVAAAQSFYTVPVKITFEREYSNDANNFTENYVFS